MKALPWLLMTAAVGTASCLWMARGRATDTGEFAGIPGAQEWFSGNQQRWCCSMADGHKATVRTTQPGRYEALVGGEWLEVPKEAVVRSEVSPWEFSVIWYNRNGGCPYNVVGGVCIRCLILSGGV